MIAGLHWTAWLLLFLAVVPGLVLSLLFLRAHSRRATGDDDAGRTP